MRLVLFLFLLSFFTDFVSYAQDKDIELAPIVINRRVYGDYIEGVSRFFFTDIEALPSSSLEEAVDYFPGIDLRQRSPFGVQQDISFRGSIFEDTSVNIEGIEVNDPQTGHFSLEMPFTDMDIKEIKMENNEQKIDFYLKKPKRQGGLVRFGFGQYSLWEQGVSLNFPLLETRNRISLEHKTSSGSRSDTDFEIYNFSFHSLWENEMHQLELIYGFTDRDFGADSFYSSVYPQEQEHIKQNFFVVKNRIEGESVSYTNNIYLRKHEDEFILDRHNPSFYRNVHRTYIYGIDNELALRYFKAKLNFERESITSTNLGDHSRFKKGILLLFDSLDWGPFNFNIRAGFDYYAGWKFVDKQAFDIDYFIKDNFKLRFSLARIWRAPSFTELYYSSPSNQGNPNLNIQRTDNYQLALLYYNDEKDVSFNMDFFRRNQRDTIDWVKNDLSSPWEAKNIGRVSAYGIDFYLNKGFNNAFLKNIRVGYTYLSLDKNNSYVFSKYVFDYLRHKLVLTGNFDVFGIKVAVVNNFSYPINREKYYSANIKVIKEFKDFSFSLEGINIFNRDYEELTNISAPKRWYKISLTYRF